MVRYLIFYFEKKNCSLIIMDNLQETCALHTLESNQSDFKSTLQLKIKALSPKSKASSQRTFFWSYNSHSGNRALN